MAKGIRYAEETKMAAVKRWREGENSQDIAKELGIHYTTLVDWKAKYKNKRGKRRMTRRKPQTIIKTTNNGEVAELKRTITELSTDLQFWKNYSLKLIREKEPQ